MRKLGIRFYAYNPLAGGLLSGKYTDFNEMPAPGRFTLRETYRRRYWKKSLFEALKLLTETCHEVDILPSEAAFRWLVHHSMMDSSKGDGIIIGASCMDQLEQNLIAVQKGALSEPVVEAFNAAWDASWPQSPEYFKFFSK